MPRPTTRKEMLEIIHRTIKEGNAVIGAGAGIGLTAKSIDKGGADLIIIYNSGKYRMAGRGSLAGLMPYGDANQIVLEMANEVLPVVEKTGVLAGVCASDPFRQMPAFLAHLKSLGFCGVQNFPTVGLIDRDSTFRQNLEETGMGFDKEVEMVRLAKKLELLTTPYVFCVEEAVQMVEAGADVLVAHMGLTSNGSIGARTVVGLPECVERIQAIQHAAANINPNIVVLCHGGPIAGPNEAEYVLERTSGVHGFFGASSMERIPVEEAVVSNTQLFKRVKCRL